MGVRQHRRDSRSEDIHDNDIRERPEETASRSDYTKRKLCLSLEHRHQVKSILGT